MELATTPRVLDAKSLKTYLEEYRAEKLAEGLAPRYVAEVCRYVERAAAFGCWATMADATEDSGRAYLGTLTRHDGTVATPKYHNNVLNMLRSFFNWAVKRRKLDANPLERVEERIDRRGEQIRAFTPAEFVALITSTIARRGGVEAALVYEVAGMTGMRRNEMRQLRVCDLQLDRAEPAVMLQPHQFKGGRKAYKAEPIPLVAPLLVDRLRERIKGKSPSSKLFPLIPHPNVVIRDIERARLIDENGRESRIPNPDALGRRLVFHSLRHMLGTTLAVAGVDMRRIQQILRHRDLKTTQKYIDAAQLPTAPALRQGVALFGDFFARNRIDLSQVADVNCDDAAGPTRQVSPTRQTVLIDSNGRNRARTCSDRESARDLEHADTNTNVTVPKTLAGQRELEGNGSGGHPEPSRKLAPGAPSPSEAASRVAILQTAASALAAIVRLLEQESRQ
jgi:integrase